MNTIEEYAAKWGATFYNGVYTPLPWVTSDAVCIIALKWAKADENSPVAKAVHIGIPEKDVDARFRKAFENMQDTLQKLDGPAADLSSYRGEFSWRNPDFTLPAQLLTPLS